MTDLTSLATRVEEAKGPSRGLDMLVLCALAAPKDAYVAQSRFNGEWCIYRGTSQRTGEPRIWEDSSWYRHGGWPLTSSLDAALALANRVLGAGKWRWERDYGGIITIVVGNALDGWTTPVESGRHCATDALALLSALLKALLAQTVEEQTR